MSELSVEFKSSFDESLKFMEEQFQKLEKTLSLFDVSSAKYKEALNIYINLIESRGQLIEQQEKLLKIHKALIPNAIINGDKIIPMGDLDSFEKNKDKKKNHNDAYSAFIDSIDSPPCAKMREIKEEFGFGFGFKRKKK